MLLLLLLLLFPNCFRSYIFRSSFYVFKRSKLYPTDLLNVSLPVKIASWLEGADGKAGERFHFL